LERVDYEEQLLTILFLAGLVRSWRISEVLAAMSLAEVVVPIVDPTLYLLAAESMEWQKRVVEATLEFQRSIDCILLEYESQK
jgi:hypothetical protein